MLKSLEKLSEVRHDSIVDDLKNQSPSDRTLKSSSFDDLEGFAVYPLTRQQKGLWFDYKLNPKSNTYNTHSQLNIKNGLDFERFRRAVNIVCNYIPIYRTRFFEDKEGEVRQMVVAKCIKDEVLEFEDISENGLSYEENYQLALKKLYQKQKTPLVLESEDNFRMYMIKHSKQEYIFTGVQHHIAIDGTSGLAFIEAVIIAYNGGLEALQKRFGEKCLYVDSYLKEYEKLEEKIAEAKNYWQKRLENGNLFLDILGKNNQCEIKQKSFSLGKKRSELIKACSKRNKTTPFIVLSTIYAVLLYRYFGQHDIAMGYPINVRPQGFKDMFGYYISVYPFRVRLDGKCNFSDLVVKVTAEQKQDRQHLYLSTDQLINMIDSNSGAINRDFNIVCGQSLFSSDFLPKMEGVEAEVKFGTGFEVKDLSLLFDLQTEELDCRLTYNAKLFDEVVVENFITNYGNLIDEILSEDGFVKPLDELQYVDVEEKTLLQKFNDTKFSYPKDQCIHDLVKEQAKKNPNNIAIIFADQKLTYKELDEKSDELAIYLQSFGVKADEIIGLCTNRNPNMLLGILAIMKSGAAYLPLDSTYPQERLKYMLDDSGVKIVLFEEGLEKVLNGIAAKDVQLISLNKEYKSQTKLQKIVKSNNLAYIIYTSGSTGNPKGVMVEHGGFVNMSLDQIRQFGVTSKDNCLQFASQNFDASVYEIFMALFSGAALTIVPSDIRSDGDLFCDYLNKHKVTVATLSPSFLRSLKRDSLKSLKTIITAGEAANVDDALFYSKTRNYINAYGPTETSVCATVHKVGESDLGKTAIPIGKPISNTQIHILDQHNQLLPVGVYGELCIAGDGLARGYLNKPEMTQEKFISNPFVTAEDRKKNRNLRLYKTGDLARWLPDGNIEYFGRIDTQVKVRGFRIELGEIENLLNKHEQIRESAVVASGEGENKQLVAYYVPTLAQTGFVTPSGLLCDVDAEHKHDGAITNAALALGDRLNANINITELKSYLRSFLPEYMIPSHFIAIEKIPLNSNGKIDRKFLSQKKIENINSTNIYISPCGEVEEILVKIFCEVLKIKKANVGIEDNFFDLGGNSISAAQVVSRIRSELKLLIELKSFFENPTVSAIAELLKSKVVLDNEPQLIKIKNRPSELSLSYSQERLWFLNQFDKEAKYNVPMAIKLRGKLDKQKLVQAFNYVIARHEVLRTAFKKTEFSVCQVVSDVAIINYEEVEISLSESQVKEIISRDSLSAFNLDVGNLLRIKLFNLNAIDEHILYVVFHHIISDGWSVGIFFQEVSNIYNSLCDGKEPNLPNLEVQYVDYAIWERSLSKNILDKQVSYWVDSLKGYSNVFDLPTDYPRPLQQSGHGGRVSFLIPRELVQSLRSYARDRGYTMYMIFFTGLYVLLKRYSGKNDICVGTPVSNRSRKELEDLIGFFVNTIALRINPHNDDKKSLTIAEIMEYIKSVILEGYKYQYAPFEEVVRKVNPIRDLSRSPIFQVMLSQQNIFSDDGNLGLKNMTAEVFDFEYNTSKFDLDFSFCEIGEDIRVALAYSSDLYREDTAIRFLKNYISIISKIVANDNREIEYVEYIEQEERDKLINEFNLVETNKYDLKQNICELFEDQVKHNSKSIAVVFKNKKITYEELEYKSRKLAKYLQKIGVKREGLIGIYFDRSIEMIIAILAVIRSGAAYVPIDSSYPLERVRYIISDSGVGVVLTHKKLKSDFISSVGCRVVNIDEDSCFDNDGELDVDISLKDLAYVIYTSGSTGQPKGVMIEHKSLANHSLFVKQKFSLTNKDVLLQFSSIAFDVSVQEIFSALVSGAKIVLRDDSWLINSNFWKLCNDYGITWIHLPAIFWQQIVLNGVDEDLPKSLANVIFGGDVVSRAAIDSWFKKKINRPNLFNAYGPTEITIDATFCKIDGLLAIVPIGKPISNTQVYILDSHNQMMPLGVYGELCIAGDGLARGYLNKPEMTQEKFISNPFVTAEDRKKNRNLRLYKTGDLARWLPDGNIEYFGRIDTQVKVRGFRIELGEIENLLNKHEQIKELAVVASGEGENKQLVAYYVPTLAQTGFVTPSGLLCDVDAEHKHEGAITNAALALGDRLNANINITELKSYLRSFLPEYMIPSHFIAIEKIPLNSNGKIDRKLLSQKEISFIDVVDEKRYVSAANEVEEKLTEIFREVLKLKAKIKISTNSSFFELGGHSLLAIYLIAKIKTEFNRDLSLALLFQYPTIRDLAAFLQGDKKQLESNLIPLQMKGEGAPLFCVPGIGGSAAYFMDLANNFAEQRPCYGLNYPGFLKGDKNYKSIESLARHYISLIKKVQKHGPYNLLGHSFGGLVVFEMAYQLQQKGQQVNIINVDGQSNILDNIQKHYQLGLTKDRSLEEIMALAELLRISENATLDRDALRKALQPLTTEARLEHLRQELVKAKIINEEISSSYLSYLARTIGMQANISYDFAEKKLARMLFIKAQDKFEKSTERALINNPSWKPYVKDLHEIESRGDHFSMMKKENATELARAVEEYLSK